MQTSEEIAENRGFPMKILVADDHPLVRAGIRATLDRADEFAIVAEAQTTDETLALVGEFLPDVLILDLLIDERQPQETIARSQEICPSIKILVLSSHTETKLLESLRETGIEGFVLKDEAPDNLMQALRVLRSGYGWFSQAVLEKVSLIADSEPCATTSLTPREQQVLDLMVLGKDNQAIAKQLMVSKQTVRRYATVIYEKLGVKNRVQAILSAAALRDPVGGAVAIPMGYGSNDQERPSNR